MNGFVNDVKRAAVEAIKADKPFAFSLGEVTSVAPLKVRVDQKLELTSSQLILTNAVRDYTVTMTADYETESASGGSSYSSFAEHAHRVTGPKTYLVKLGLTIGERVLLLRTDGGQKYIILDRVEVPV